MSEIKAKKKFGQNFLKDENIINKIINSVDSVTKTIIEIGPGMGALTKRLINKCDKLIAYEIDNDCVNYLNEKIKSDKLNIISQDFLKADLSLLDNIENAYLVSNIPYYITSPIISRFIFDMKSVNGATFMVQKEVGDRLSAKVKTKDYNSFTILVQYYMGVERVVNVNRNSFSPVPNVDSVVLKLNRINRSFKPTNEEFFKELVETSFKERRKLLTNNLNGFHGLNKQDIENILIDLDKPITTRAEELTIDEFIIISNRLYHE